MNLIKHKVHIDLGHSGRRDDRPEEVRSPIVGLIAHHECALLHHASLDDGAELQEDDKYLN